MKKGLIVLIIIIAGAGGWCLANIFNKPNEEKNNTVINTMTNEANSNITTGNTKNNENATTNNKTENVTNKTVNNTENTNNNEKQENIYESLISEYNKTIKEFDLNDVNAQDKIKNKLINASLIMHVKRYESNGTKLTFDYYDIDKNGTKELIIGASGAPGAIYTYDTGKKEIVKLYFQDTLERGNLDIYDNGVILSESAGGAMLHYFEYGKISKEGNSYTLLEKIEEEYKEQDGKPSYKNFNTNQILNYTSKDKIKQKYIANSQVVKFNK